MKVEVTWAQTIAKYMGVLLVHRGVIALQLRDVYSSPPKDKNANQIHQILFFVGALEMYLNQATGKDKSFEQFPLVLLRHSSPGRERRHTAAGRQAE